MVNQLYWIWFQLLFGFGTARSHQVLVEEPNPEELYHKISSESLPYNFLRQKERENWRQCWNRGKELEEITYAKKCEIITLDHPDYPPLLHHIYAKPVVLYVKGDLSVMQNSLSFAIVGARRNTRYGEKVAETFARGLAQKGAVVVSGLAFGIDSISLNAGIEQGGKAVGVLACGLDYDYPKGNAKIKRQVCENGAVISEFPMGTRPRPYMFPPRNRIIAGMTNGTIIIEAGTTSGALVTARHALESDRDLFVPPGGIFSGTFEGSHSLLREGVAKLVSSPRDVLEDYVNIQPLSMADTKNIETAPKITGGKRQILPIKKKTKPPLPEGMELAIEKTYEEMCEEMKTPDDFAVTTGLPIGEILGALTTLEILGLAKSHPGGYFTLP